jgi:hypothetical protein
MGESFGLIGLGFIAFVFYTARKNGQLTFNLNGYDALIDEWLGVVYVGLRPVTQDMTFDQRNKYRRGVTDELRKILSAYFTDSQFPRTKIHDLEKAMMKRINLSDQPWKRLDVEDVIYECFKRIAERYDNAKIILNSD